MRRNKTPHVDESGAFDELPNRTDYAVSRRIIDFCLAAGLVVLTLPLMLLVALAIKISQPGPVFVRQKRIGQGGCTIDLLKFRTMHVDAAEVAIRNFTIKSDPRVTRIGRFLRNTSIDELPQLFNVLRGDLSFVGPRPALPFELAAYEDLARHNKREAFERFSVPPGLTGLWQVSGSPRGDFGSMIAMDIKYVREHNFWMDLKIIVRTVALMFTGRSAY